MQDKIVYKNESYSIMGACFEVYREMGHGFLEPVYQECLEIEMEKSKIPYKAKRNLPLKYKGEALKQSFQPDFVCYDKIILEIKATDELTTGYEAQLLNYLNATKYKLGLLVNFGHYPKLEYKRMVL